MSEKRQFIVVDIETSGLNPGIHIPIEVAAINVDTDETLMFIPVFGSADLSNADPDALRINRYFERGVYRGALNQQATADAYDRLFSMLDGNTLAGANPRFDAAMLIHGYKNLTGRDLSECWHHRLPDVSSYVAGALGINPAELPGLHDCCKTLGVTNEGEHSALGDAKATVECFRNAALRSFDRDAAIWANR